MSSKQVLIRMPEPLHAALKEHAKSDGISLTQLINQISKQYLIRLKPKSFEGQTNKNLDKDGSSNQNCEPFANTSETKVKNVESSLESTTEIQRLSFLENQVLLLHHQVLALMSVLEANSALSETYLANDQATKALYQRHSFNQLTQVPSSTSHCTHETSRQWLCLDEAYTVAQQQGYSHSRLAFKMLITCLKNPNLAYQQYQLGIDLSRYNSRGEQSACFYHLPAK